MTNHSLDPLYEPLNKENSLETPAYCKPSNFFQQAFYRYLKHPFGIIGIVLLISLSSFAWIAPIFSSYSFKETNLAAKNQSPTFEHLFGTDDLGRDIFVRSWQGAKISLTVGFLAALIDMFLGVLIGGFSGIYGGKIDEIIMRITDLLYALPYLLIVILLMMVLSPGLIPILIALSITGWITMARNVRSQVIYLKQMPYTEAARAIGANELYILFKHILPNSIGPIIVTATLTIPSAIYTEAFLSFLGLGIKAPIASLGTMVNESLSAFRYYPWRLFFPAGIICLIMLSFNLIGDALRDALDPKTKG